MVENLQTILPKDFVSLVDPLPVVNMYHESATPCLLKGSVNCPSSDSPSLNCYSCEIAQQDQQLMANYLRHLGLMYVHRTQKLYSYFADSKHFVMTNHSQGMVIISLYRHSEST